MQQCRVRNRRDFEEALAGSRLHVDSAMNLVHSELLFPNSKLRIRN